MTKGCATCGDNLVTNGIWQAIDKIRQAATNDARFGNTERKAKDRRDG